MLSIRSEPSGYLPPTAICRARFSLICAVLKNVCNISGDDAYCLPRCKGFDLLYRRLAIADTTDTEYFEVGGVTVSCAARNATLSGFSVTVQTSFVTTGFVDVLFLCHNVIRSRLPERVFMQERKDTFHIALHEEHYGKYVNGELIYDAKTYAHFQISDVYVQ